MKESLQRILKYWPQYEWANVFTMIKNMSASPEPCDRDFNDRLVVITGATSGIGYLTARKYASRGARLLTINRNEKKSQALQAEIERDFGTECRYWIADLSRLDDMHRVGHALADLREPIDVLIHNAGLYLVERASTSDGLEMNFAVHYLAPFVINYLIEEKSGRYQKSQRDRRGRVILVSSEGYRFTVWGPRLDDLQWEKRRYGGLKAYGAAKTAQILTMQIFAERWRDSGVTINAMHPGLVATNSGQENGPLYRWFKHHVLDRVSQSPEISAQALYYLGVSPEIDGISGRFFHMTREEELTPPARDMEVAEKLWQISLELGRLQ